MAKEIIDIYIEQGYPYVFDLNFDLYDGTSLESDYTAYFECDSLGSKTFSVTGDIYTLIFTEEDTQLLATNLEEYVVYVVHNTTSEKDKVLSGRIVVDKRVRSL